MGIQRLFERKYGGFISLDEVISQISKSSGCGYQDAATVLRILLDEDFIDAPIWRVKDRLNGISDASTTEKELADKTLKNIAVQGYPDDGVPF